MFGSPTTKIKLQTIIQPLGKFMGEIICQRKYTFLTFIRFRSFEVIKATRFYQQKVFLNEKFRCRRFEEIQIGFFFERALRSL